MRVLFVQREVIKSRKVDLSYALSIPQGEISIFSREDESPRKQNLEILRSFERVDRWKMNRSNQDENETVGRRCTLLSGRGTLEIAIQLNSSD